MRSCSPSLRVVPSYRINFTKDKANIFSDLSLAVGGREETHEEDNQTGGETFLFCVQKCTCAFCVYLQTNRRIFSVRLQEIKDNTLLETGSVAVNHAARLALQQVINKPADK